MIHLGELLSAHLDGELSLGEARLVAGHLEVCGQCRVEFDDLAGARAAVRSLPSLELPESVTVSIPPTVSRSVRRVSTTRVAAAAAVMVMILGTLTLLEDPAPETVTAGDLGAVYVARASVSRDLAPTPKYIDPQQLVVLGGGE